MSKLLTTLLIFPLILLGQINFDNKPEDFQLYPRDQNNNSTVTFSGTVTKEIHFDELVLKVFKNEVLISNEKFKIIDKKFKVDYTIKAGLFQYKFEIHNEKEKESLVYVANDIVSGDAYIITGQSNSHASSKKSTYSSPFARSFGVKTGYESYTSEDKKVRWGLATGNCKTCEGDQWDSGYDGGWFVKIPHGVGVWGMELAKLLIEKHQIPVCIINGGSGSSTIEENMLYPEKISLETSFGRLAYRADQAKIKNNIKAIFYHQGESDTNLKRSLSYKDNFHVLNTDWQRVYTGLQKIYLFQIHPGCGGDSQSELREIQNQISKKYNIVEIMSTTGVKGHDGCHFSYEGYKEFAERILPLVSRDIFAESILSIITPPQLLTANYSDTREITLTFDQPIKMDNYFEVDEKKYFMKNQFFFSTNSMKPSISGVIMKMQVKKNKLILFLNGDEKYSKLTWLPNKEYLKTKDIYNGPWIRGKTNNLGALSFDSRAISEN